MSIRLWNDSQREPWDKQASQTAYAHKGRHMDNWKIKESRASQELLPEEQWLQIIQATEQTI